MAGSGSAPNSALDPTTGVNPALTGISAALDSVIVTGGGPTPGSAVSSSGSSPGATIGTYPVKTNSVLPFSGAGMTSAQVMEILHKLDPAAVADAGAAHTQVGATLDHVATRLAQHAQTLSQNWSGSAAQAAMGKIQQLYDQTAALSAQATQVGAVLTWLGTKVLPWAKNLPDPATGSSPGILGTVESDAKTGAVIGGIAGVSPVGAVTGALGGGAVGLVSGAIHDIFGGGTNQAAKNAQAQQYLQTLSNYLVEANNNLPSDIGMSTGVGDISMGGPARAAPGNWSVPRTEGRYPGRPGLFRGGATPRLAGQAPRTGTGLGASGHGGSGTSGTSGSRPGPGASPAPVSSLQSVPTMPGSTGTSSVLPGSPMSGVGGTGASGAAGGGSLVPGGPVMPGFPGPLGGSGAGPGTGSGTASGVGGADGLGNPDGAGLPGEELPGVTGFGGVGTGIGGAGDMPSVAGLPGTASPAGIGAPVNGGDPAAQGAVAVDTSAVGAQEAGPGMTGFPMTGGGAGQSDKERQRHAWMNEDEDIWVSDVPVVPPVIYGDVDWTRQRR